MVRALRDNMRAHSFFVSNSFSVCSKVLLLFCETGEMASRLSLSGFTDHILLSESFLRKVCCLGTFSAYAGRLSGVQWDQLPPAVQRCFSLSFFAALDGQRMRSYARNDDPSRQKKYANIAV